MTRYFVSDEHYDHHNILRYCDRPFASVQEMREEMIKRHNAVVKADDEVLHLGDFSMAEPTVRLVLNRLNGKHSLIVGNHDKCFGPKDRTGNVKRRYFTYGFTTINDRLYMKIGEYNVLVAHFPLRGGDTTDLRYIEQRPTKQDLKGAVALLHGHIHGKWKVRMFDGTPMVNAGVDVWDYGPVSEETLAETIREALAAS